MTATDKPVVIGTDGSPSSQMALMWGVRYAQRRGTSVILLRSRMPALGLDLAGLEVVESFTSARDELERVRAATAAEYPTVPVSGRLVEDHAVRAIVEMSYDAGAVVLGTHGAEPFASPVVGTTTLRVAARAHCPVVAVPDSSGQAFGGAGVAVGVDGSHQSDDALRFAFQEAEGTGDALTAVFAWTDPLIPSLVGAAIPVPTSAEALMTMAGETLRSWVEPWASKHPDVVVHRRVVREHPLRALSEASKGSRLVVVGSRGRGAVRSMLLGSVSHGLLQLAACPVAVVHDGA